MYNDHFGLTEAPFSIAPNPDYLFMSRRYQKALMHLLYGIYNDGGFILLTGEVGTGKTTLCRRLLEKLAGDVDTAFILNPRLSALELLATVCDEFKIEHAEDDSLKKLNDHLNAFLLKQHAADQKSVLIIDEAQNLSQEVLEQLRLLTNLETSERKLLQIVLIGQPELLETLADRSQRQFNQRVAVRYHLNALNQPETQEYIEHRMKIAGGDPTVFSPASTRKIFTLSGGIPRVINLICDRALLGAYAEGKKKVSKRIATKAAKEVLGSPSRRLTPLLATAAAALFAVIATWFLIENRSFIDTSVAVTAAPVTSTAKTASAPPVETGVQAKATELSGHTTLDAAYHDLFAVWGTAFEDKERDACELGRAIGLECLNTVVTFDELIELNRPVIVNIDNAYLTISEIGVDGVTLFVADAQFELSRQEFIARFDGRIDMVWRMPPAYQAPLRVHDRGAAVDWLVLQLAIIEGNAPPLETGFTYTEEFEARVRAFQASVGLTPNGIVDPMTWIHINSVEAVSIPTLNHQRRG